VFALVCTVSGASFSACASAPADDRASRHFEAAVWGGALQEQLQRPDRYVIEGTLLATIPAGIALDHDIQRHEEGRAVSSTTKTAADALPVLLGAGALAIAGTEWARGDEGRHFEVAAESLGGVAALTQLLKDTVGRQRPNGRSTTSFPSGHASFSFAATTLLVRDLHDPSDDSFHAVDALMYVPALFVGWERVASDHHWTSDVASGAFLGVFLTNWIWDAHFRSGEETRPAIFENGGRHGMVWRPSVDAIDGRLALGVEAGF
jgi:PAP2 superfamily